MSIWSDIHKKSNGEVRKEDMFEFFDTDRISAEDLQKMLRQGIVRFKYRKKAKKGQPWDSGDERIAWGTKKMEVVSKIPHGGDCPPKRAGYSIYFDLEKEDWRAFNDALLLGVCPKVLTQDEFDKIYPMLMDE